MKLSELITNLDTKEIIGDLNLNIKGIYHDSREVKRDFLFVCIKGFTSDGHNFIDEAIKKGAVALVVKEKIPPRPGITIIKIDDTRLSLIHI